MLLAPLLKKITSLDNRTFPFVRSTFSVLFPDVHNK